MEDNMHIPMESLNFMMLNVGFAQHNADWNWKNVSSPFARIYYVTEGLAFLYIRQDLQIADNITVLKPNHLYIIPAYTIHSYVCNGIFSHYYLHVCEGFKKETDIFEYYDFPIEIEATDIDALIFKQMCDSHPEAKLPASDPTSYDNTANFTNFIHRYNELSLFEKMRLRGSILMLFSQFMQYARPCLWTKDERMSGVLQYIHNNIYENIDLDSIASVACVSKQYLIRIFKKHFGISPLQYIHQKKIEKSQLLLMTEDLQIKEIAYTLAFNDYSYFIRLFKKITGITPNEYRRTMR